MAFADKTSVYQMTMHFSFGNAGWSEKVFFDVADRATAKTKAATVLNYRKRCLPVGLQVDYAAVHNLKNPRDASIVGASYPILGTYNPLSGSPAVEDPEEQYPNAANDGIQLRFESDDGNWADRWFKGVPDARMSAAILTTDVGEATGAPAAIPSPDTDDWVTRVKAYLDELKTDTHMFRERTTGTLTVMQLSPCDRIIPRKVGSKKCGVPFGISRGRARPH